MYGSTLRKTDSKSTSEKKNSPQNRRSFKLLDLIKLFYIMYVTFIHSLLYHYLYILPPSLGSGSSSTFSWKSLCFGKPSKCLARTHDLAWTMVINSAGSNRDVIEHIWPSNDTHTPPHHFNCLVRKRWKGEDSISAPCYVNMAARWYETN